MNTSVTQNVQGSLKDALYETLNELLSPHGETRIAAEQKMKALEVTEEFGVHLTEFVIDQNGRLAIRQLASVLLKQYVETHWCKVAEKFRAPEVNVSAKVKIKSLLPNGLSESISKIRTAVAYAISAIACWDWPEHWQELFNIIVECLSGENKFAVHGAMRVLSEFTRELSETQFPNVGPVILREMYRILENENEYSVRIRGRAVELFTTITSIVATTDMYKKGFARAYLEPVIPMFCEKFVYILAAPNGPYNDIGLKTEVIKAINCLMMKLSKYVVNYLPQMMPPVWNAFTQSAKVYQEQVVNGKGDLEDDQDVDSDGEVINFNNLIIVTLELIGTLLDQKKLANSLDEYLEDILYQLMIFMQVTDEQIELWANDPNQFVEDEDVNPFVYNVRVSAQDLLQNVLIYGNERAVNAMWTAIMKHLETVNGNGRGNEHWWKIHEACILALSLSHDSILEHHKAGHLQFDINLFFNNVVLVILNDPGAHALLLGRCLCLGGQHASIMSPEMCSRFVEATVNGLQENQSICIKISALKAIFSYTELANSGNEEIRRILVSHLPAIFEGLFSLANQPSKEVLSLAIETLSVVVALDPHTTARMENKICPLTIAVLLKFHNDGFIPESCQNIFKELTKNPECREPLQTRIVPTLVAMMNAGSMEKYKDEECHELALDVLKVLVQHSPQPLNNLLATTAFSAACHCILNSEDKTNVLQSGSELLRIYLSTSPTQVMEYRDSEGRTGIQYVLQIVAQILNPQSNEFTAFNIGPLLVTLMKKVGCKLGENLDLLLKAVLSKMQRTETLSVMQSLLMVFAHLINTEFEAVLNFLSTVPGPTGQSALAFVLSKWLSRQHEFYGLYDRKVSIVALCKILEYGVTSDDSRLNEIMVKGDLIFTGYFYREFDVQKVKFDVGVFQNNEGTRTRSKSQGKPLQYTTVPALVKIFKLVISELSTVIEDVTAPNINDTEEDDDEEEGDDDEIDPGNESWFRLDNFKEENLEEEDPDILQDSIYHLNIAQYLQDFLKNFSSHHCFNAFVQQLNNAERKVLLKLNVNAAAEFM